MSGSAQINYWDLMAPPADYKMIDTDLAKGVAQYYRDWVAHPVYDDYWKQWSIEEHFDRIKVPAIHIAAWYDIFQDGGIRNYLGIRRAGGTEAARKGQRLVVIPGGHAGWGTKIGEIEYGPGATFSTWELAMRWFDWQLRGIDDGLSKEKPVKIFMMGENVFRDEDEWPLARAVSTRYHLRSGGNANSLAGDGALAPEVGGEKEAADRFVYDPANPVPTHGGAVLGIPFSPAGPFDQRVVEGRQDVLVYTTSAFPKAFEVTGPVSAELYLSSSAVDTDIVAKLVDVYPDGRAINLSEGILRLRYRNSFERAELMNPGEIYKVVVDLWSTANVFLPGHKLRLEVSSSSFPRFDRNLNTGGSPRIRA
jgi:putative CocE/NonD family hydrolase